MLKNKKIVKVVSYTLLGVLSLGIGFYLYKTPYIREKLSFASSMRISDRNSKLKESPIVTPKVSEYEFSEYETQGRFGEINSYGTLATGQEIVGGKLQHADEKLGSFPMIWINEQEFRDYYMIDTAFGSVLDMNDKGLFTTTYGKETNNGQYSYVSILNNYHTGEDLELKSPIRLIATNSFSSSSLKNSTVLKLKEDLINHAPKGVAEEIFNYSYPTYSQVVPYSVNNNGDVGGAVYTDTGSIAVVWLKSNDYRPLNISSMISQQLGKGNPTEQNIYLIDDNMNLWANARVGSGFKLGYFKYVGVNQWKLKQSWTTSYPSPLFLDLRGHSKDSAIIREDYDVEGRPRSNNYVYFNTEETASDTAAKNPYILKFRVEDALQDIVSEGLEYVTVFNVNSNNQIIGHYYTLHTYGFFMMDLETRSAKLFSDMLKSGSINLPEGFVFNFPYLIDDSNNIFISFHERDVLSPARIGVLTKK